jgi:hypothetical protein
MKMTVAMLTIKIHRVKTNEVGEFDGGDNPTCVKDDNKVVVDLENLTCETRKEQRETKLDIDHDR